MYVGHIGDQFHRLLLKQSVDILVVKSKYHKIAERNKFRFVVSFIRPRKTILFNGITADQCEVSSDLLD